MFTPTKTRYLLASGGCLYEPCSSLHRNQIPITGFDCQRILLRFHLLKCQGKLKCSARCPSFSLSAFPRASSQNSQSLFYHQQTSSHWHQGEWDNSLIAESVTEGFWACCGGCGTGWPATYLAHLLTWTITSKTSKTWKFAEISVFDLCLGPLRENTE